ncbi:N-acyl homoserine lactonase family protein [Hyphococcus lacteus]|uniref:N-acyl homoserine lactonase family protein n=1 Tax=Hyphococcus lacteus TaxID=3143536 RepID=A0ABV3Z8A1_9PROT
MKRFLSLSFLALAACGQGENGPSTDTETTSAANVKLYALDCGRVDMNDLSIFTQGNEYDGRTNKAASTCYLIRHPDGDLIWDAGFPDALNDAEGGITNGPFHVSLPIKISTQLDQLGLSADDIEYLSLSHTHFDHVGGAGQFAGSTFIVHESEREFMFRDDARADEQGFAAYAALENAETIEFTGDYDVFGDGSVTILSMPGHTPGHTSLTVNLANEGPVMLVGDLYHLNESREHRYVPKFNTDVEDTLASMDRFEGIAKENGARVVIQHSMKDFEALPKFPAYLD